MTITQIPRSLDGSAYSDSESFFFAGDYEHNQEVLDDILKAESWNAYDDEDRLIYAATKKFASAHSVHQQEPMVVSSRELIGSDSSRSGDEHPISRYATMGRSNLIRILQRDDDVMEVTREEVQRVRLMHNRFLDGSIFSFNYNTLLVIASIIAALGLGSDSTATIIASMLVSPLMGPVMGMAYAATIQDFKMFRIACFTEIVSLLSCIIIGVIVSLSMTPFKVSEDFPTPEQSSRGTVENLYIGIPVAFFSGLGVAVSVLDEQTSSLVGVAISASLLPPAVNAGMLWATHFFYKGEGEAPIGLLQDGLISLVLTIVNIIMIIISSMIMFRLKERMQIKRKKIFWTDLGLARKIYRNLAVFPSVEAEALTSGVRRMGHRVSMFVHQSPFASARDRHGRNSEENDSSSHNNVTSNDERHCGTDSNRKLSNLDVPPGSEDFTTKALSTVLEERQSGNSEANRLYIP